MKYVSVELNGYNRLRLNHINSIKISPQSKLQLILGTNGSGKSSLIHAMSGLPASKDDFQEGGSKVEIFHHNNSIYELKSCFDGKPRYNFIKDGEELNTGGTASTFKELSYKELGLTPDIHKLRCGITKFTGMSVAERRSWFNLLSDADYTYAFKFYNKLKEHHRDLTGAIKMKQSRLVQESDKLLDPEELEKTKLEVKELNDLLDKLFALKSGPSVTAYTLEANLRENTRSMERLVKSLHEDFSSIAKLGLSIAPDMIDDELINLHSRVKANERRIAELLEIVDQNQETVIAIRNSGVSKISNIEEELKALNLSIEKKKFSSVTSIYFEDPKEALAALDAVSGRLTEILAEMPPNPYKAISKAFYEENKASLQTAVQKREAINAEMIDLTSKRKELEHLREHSETVCPACQHRWFRDFDEVLYKQIVEKIALYNKELDNLDKVIPALESKHQEAVEYLSMFRNYVELTKAWPILQPFWEHLLRNDIIFESPMVASAQIGIVREDICLLIAIAGEKEKIKEIYALRELYQKNQELDLSKLEVYLDKVNAEISELTSNNFTDKRLIDKHESFKRLFARMEKVSSDLEVLFKDRERTSKDIIAAIQNESIMEMIAELRRQIQERTQAIDKMSSQQALVKFLEDEVAALMNRAELVKIAMRELSPNEGLIAKGLSAFINSFMLRINKFISKIWLYPLELVLIEPDESESVDLDYKFSLKVNNEFPVGDIAEGSSAMKEIIDLAFLVTAMQYLHMSDYPLFLDEFAKTMDVAHRQSAIHAITNQLAADSFSQIFMISHYEDSYGSLKNCDVTVLCPSNIALPKDMAFNKHVQMT